MVIEVTFDTTDVYISTTVSPVYVNVSFEAPSGGGGAEWGDITGTLSDQTDLQTALDGKFDDPTGTTSQYLRGDGSLATFPSLTGFVPYTGATANVDLGTHTIIAQNATIASSGSGDTVAINHSSGSGIALNISKGGNGEGLYINKTGGSGNAATIIGTINATTIVKSGGTSSQFLKADGTVDSSVYVPTSRELTINGVTYDLSANRTWTISAGISGSGASGQVSYWDGSTSQAGSNNLFWDAANGRLGIGTNAPAVALDVRGDTIIRGSGATTAFTVQNNSATNLFRVNNAGNVGIGFTGSLVYKLELEGGNFRLSNTGLTQQLGLGFSGGGFNLIGSLTNTPLHFLVNSTARAVLFTTGNLAIGSTTDSGERLQVTGDVKVTGASTFNGNMTLSLNQAASTILTVSNTTNAAGANVYARITASGGSIDFGKQSSSSGAYKIIAANDGFVNNGGAGDLAIHNDVATGNIKFAAGGSSTAQLTLHNTGNLLLGSTTNSGERLQVTGDVKIVNATLSSTHLKIGTNSFVGSLTTPAIAFNTTSGIYTDNNRISFVSVGNYAGAFSSAGYIGNHVWVSSTANSNDLNTPKLGGYRLNAAGLSSGVAGNSAGDISIATNNLARITATYTGEVGIGITPTALLDLNASTTARASLRIRSGLAPTTPNDGDIWFDGTDIKMRIGGVTKTFTLI